MSTFESRLVVSLIDKTSPAKAAAANLAGVERAAKSLGSVKATGLSEISTALAKIAQHREAERRLAEFGAANERARAKVRALATDLIAVEKPAKAMTVAYQAATRAADQAAKQLARQEATVQKSAAGLHSLGIAAGEVNAAEAMLAAQAAKVTAALQKEAIEASKAARMRDSLSKEMVRAANEEASANLRSAEAEKRAEAEKIAASLRAAEAVKRAEAEKVAAVEQGARRRREALAREFAREAADQAAANRRMVEEERRRRERQARDALRDAEARRSSFRQSVGMLAPFAGPAIVRETASALGAGATYEQRLAQMRAAGMNSSEIAAAKLQADELTKRYPALRKEEVLELSKEARSVIQERHEAAAATEIMAQARAAMLATGDTTGAEGVRFYVKGAETLGRAKNAEEFRAYVDAMVKARQVMGGTITPEEQREIATYSRNAGMRLSDRFLFTTANSLAQEIGGSQAGTSIASFYQHAFSGRMTKQGVANLFHAGLLDPSDVKMKEGADAAVIRPGHHIRDYETARTDPDKWVWGVEERLKAKGMSDAEREHWWGATFDRRTADFALKMVGQRKAFENHAAMYGQAMGLDAVRLSGENLIASQQGLKSSIDNLAATITAPVTTDMATGADWLSRLVGKGTGAFERLQKDHPDVARSLSWLGTGASLGAGGYLSWKSLVGITRFFTGAGASNASAAATLAASKGGGATAATTAAITKEGGWWGARALAKFPWLSGAGRFVGLSGRALGPVMMLRDLGEAVNPMTPEGYPYRLDQKITPDMWEKSRRAQDEFRRDPEAARGRAMSDPMRITKPDLSPHSVWPGAAGAGEDAGSAAGEGVANGLGRQSGLVRSAAEQILADIRAVLSQGVEVPVRVNASGAGAAQAPVRAALRGALGDTGDSFI
ncbi:MAG: hypothetical protein LWW93_12010 [Hyphomicrobiales bacterium]|nr:hypothetical protein [Hyphomicrobiales bacterium]